MPKMHAITLLSSGALIGTFVGYAIARYGSHLKLANATSPDSPAGPGGRRGGVERMTSWFHPRKVAATQPTEGSDNRAFEEHKKEALERLQDEQRQFEEFLNELRYAKDKEEFDEFLASKA